MSAANQNIRCVTRVRPPVKGGRMIPPGRQGENVVTVMEPPGGGNNNSSSSRDANSLNADGAPGENGSGDGGSSRDGPGGGRGKKSSNGGGGGGGTEREFSFDRCFGQDTRQLEVFEHVARPLAEHVLSGFNACCFAYGQTGSGKTHSMVGGDGESRGIVPRSMEYIFQEVQRRSRQRRFAVYVSFLEIYLDQIRDLGRFGAAKTAAGATPLSSTGMPGIGAGEGATSAVDADADYATQSLEIHEAPDGRVFVKDLRAIPVDSVAAAMRIVRAGFSKRATFETAMNPVSSRSHTVFSITVASTPQVGAGGDGDTMTGTLNLVDLAGSERLTKSLSSGKRLEEARMISKSLSALANVVVALSESAAHVPYRDSKLTRVLQNSLGGNSFTTLLATLHPDDVHFQETIATLQFATRCRHVSNAPRVNYMDFNPEAQERRIRKLMAEIADLRGRLEASEARAEAAASAASSMGGKGGRGAHGGAYGRSSLGGASGRAAEELEQARRMVELINADKKALSRKLDKRKEDFRAVQERLRAVQERHVAQVQALRETILELSNSVETGRHVMIAQLNAAARQHEDEVNRLVGSHQELLDEQARAVAQITAGSRAKRDAAVSADEQLRRHKAKLDAEHRALLSGIGRDNQADLDALEAHHRKLSEAAEKRHREEMHSLGATLRETREKLDVVTRDREGLIAKLDLAMETIERAVAGEYPLVAEGASGRRRLRIPSSRIPQPIAELERARMGAGADQRLMGTADNASSARQSTRAGSDRGSVRSTRSARSSRLSSAGSERGHRADDRDAEAENNELRDRIAQLEQQLEEAHQHQDDNYSNNNHHALAQEEKEKIEEQVLNDLAAHETVEYITSLEAERDEYRRRHAEELRRVRQLQSSLEAQKRLQAKQGGFGGNTLNSSSNTSMDATARSRPRTAGTMSARRVGSARR